MVLYVSLVFIALVFIAFVFHLRFVLLLLIVCTQPEPPDEELHTKAGQYFDSLHCAA